MSFVGIPFREGGDSRSGAHCWGLVRLVYREDYGIDLPEHAEITSRDLLALARVIDDESAGDPWRKVEDPQPGDVVVMGMHGRRFPVHVGVYWHGGKVLHVEKATASVCVPIDHFSVRGRVLGFFRHEAMQ